MPSKWAGGYAPRELERAQRTYHLTFPPDLIALYLRRRPTQGYDWRKDDAALRRALAWPADGLIFDVEHNVLWPAGWGPRPDTAEERATIVRAVVARAPPLIPLMGHRYLVAEPCEAGNPVLSVYQSDIIYYGATLDDYFNIELRLGAPRHFAPSDGRRIRFWSDFIV